MNSFEQYTVIIGVIAIILEALRYLKAKILKSPKREIAGRKWRDS